MRDQNRDGGSASWMEVNAVEVNAVEAHVLCGGELGEVGGSDAGKLEANAPLTRRLRASLFSL